MNGLIKLNRGRDLRHLQSEFDRLFDSFLPRENRPDLDLGNWSPRADITENENSFTVELDIPGMSKDDIDISFHDGVLGITGERVFEEKAEDGNLYRYERQFGRFSRSFTLGKAVNPENISASYDNGVLIVTVPKAEESKPRRIKVD
ncbi:MAG: Hsp20/alpha crystallin family protein [Rhodothermales bacterium]|nr:Hsp20/alpha crystallin family protein [Rhodothermales bacterium]